LISRGQRRNAASPKQAARYVERMRTRNMVALSLIGLLVGGATALAEETPALPSAVLRSDAAATRTGPLIPLVETVEDFYLFGPVKQVTLRTMKIAATGSEVLSKTRVLTFNSAGLVLTSVISDANGKITNSFSYTYDANNRAIGGESMYLGGVKEDAEVNSSIRFDYDAEGNITTETTVYPKEKTTVVTRYQRFPNGYSTESFDDTGASTSRDYVLMNKFNKIIAMESDSYMATTIYEESQIKRKTIGITGMFTTTREFEKGVEVRQVSTREGVLRGIGDTTTIYSNEKLDGYGNFTRRVSVAESTSFGFKRLTPSEVLYQEIEYR